MRGRGPALALAVAALAVLAGTLALLLHGAPRQTGSDRFAPQQFVLSGPARAGMCQAGETLYAKTGSLKLTIATGGAPTRALDVTVRAGGRTLARGSVAAGWSEGELGIPIAPVPRTSTAGTTICVHSTGPGKLFFGGEPIDHSLGAVVDGVPQNGRASIFSYRTGRPSLLGVAGDVVDHYGRGNARWLGGWTWIVMIALLLAGLGAAGAALLVPRHARRLAVAAALALATTWALLIPPFMVPDELAHVAYVQSLVETGKLPVDRPDQLGTSPRETDLLAGLDFYNVIGDATSKPPWTAAEEARLRAADRSHASRVTTDAGTASSNPPLYYLAEAPVYAATRGTGMLEQQLPMRLVSVLFGGLTVFFVFGFLRELLPRHPLAWATGAVAVALQPLFGFVTAGVNADAAMFACSAAALWALTAVLRRGLTLRSGLVLGAALAVGMLAKPLFLGLVPAGLVALGLAALRLDAPWSERARLVGAGLAVAVLPVVAYSFVGDALSAHPYFPDGLKAGAAAVGGESTAPSGLAGLRKEAIYLWQLFLPRLSFMQDQFPGPSLPLRVTWFDGFVGRFGWLDYAFARWVTGVAVWIAFAVLALAGAALIRLRDRVLSRWRELLCFLLAVAGVLGAIGVQQYNASITGAPALTQTRYLLPLLGLYGALVALAAHGLGRRAAPYVATGLLTLAALHETAAMVLTITRFYA